MDDELPEGFIEFLRRTFGDQADEVLDQLRASGIDLSQLAAMPGMDATADQIQQMLERMRAVMAASGDAPVNLDIARDVARQAALQGGDPAISGAAATEVGEAFLVAELWLDPVVDFDPAPGPVHAWSASEWVEATLNSWRQLVEPIAERVADGLAESLADDEANPMMEALANATDHTSVIRQMGGAMFAFQLGHAAGTAARAVFGGTDLGLPLIEGKALLPTAVAEFSSGLDVPEAEVRLYLAVREAARARLFAHAGWLRSHLVTAIEEYARGIEIDLSTMRDALSSFNPADMDSLSEALSPGMFEPAVSDSQRAALAKLETGLALVEGWVDHVSSLAVAPHLPAAGRLLEMMQRRRAAGGPAEDAFASLVGLELRPKRARDAAALFARLEEAGGISARDQMWEHPDLLPEADDLDGTGSRADAAASAEDDDVFDAAALDAALEQILAEDDALSEWPVYEGGSPEATESPAADDAPDASADDDRDDNPGETPGADAE